MARAPQRLALIVVVPEYRFEAAANLKAVVRNDAQALERSLTQSGYETRVVGVGAPSEASRGTVLAEIRDICARAEEGATLLMFFSGHGVHFGGTTYLVPWDGDLRYDPPQDMLLGVTRMLSPVDGCRARCVVAFVDACREAVKFSAKGLQMHQVGADARGHLVNRQFALVYSCRPGDFSHYVAGEDGFSIFSRALAATLAADHPARTLGAVLNAAQQQALDLARSYQQPERVFSRLIDTSSSVLDAIVCEGQAHPALSAAAAWDVAVLASPLWSRCSGPAAAPERVAAFRAAAAGLAAEAHRAWVRADAALPDDPWRDERYPVRVTQRIADLVLDAGLMALDAGEVALLVAAPFVREYAQALALLALAAASPVAAGFEPPADLTEDAAALRRPLAATYKAHPQALRKAALLVDSAPADSRAVLYWLLHRHLVKFAAQWQPVGRGGTLGEGFSDWPRMLRAPVDSEAGAAIVTRALTRERMLKLAKCVRCEADRLHVQGGTAVEIDGGLDDPMHPLEVAVLPAPSDPPIREQMVGVLLCLGGWMALDLRLADAVVVDQVGIADSVDLAALRSIFRDARWEAVGRVRRLVVECGHPAGDHALRELVAHANHVLGQVTQLLAADPPQLPEGLPAQLLPDGIRPEDIDGRAAYGLPHHRFTLAHQEVRELLMGEQLYGNPDLALRELYQNALDACRYADARVRFLRQGGRPLQWRGRIELRQGHVDDRAYLECEDNGVGMGLRELEHCFARAGKRFADLPEFIEEQEIWAQASPRIEIHPNSQFGIGVLSYFMIADEIELETCRLRRDGSLGATLAVRIPGTGSLFRVRPALAPRGRSGTRLRLYLRVGWSKSCCDVLRQLLVVADFDTHASDGQRTCDWQAGQPIDPDRYLRTDDPDIWWDKSINGGALLNDGLVVEELPSGSRRCPVAGVLANCRGPHRPRLTVDRKKALDVDEAWLKAASLAQLPHLVGQPWLRLSLLWNMPDWALAALLPRLAAADAHLPLGYAEELNRSYRFSYATDEDRTQRLLDQLGALDHGLPVAVIGLDPDDVSAIDGLVRAWVAQAESERLDVLQRIGVIMRADVPVGMSLEQVVELLKDDTKVIWRRPLQRLALYVALGVPAPEWLLPLLPAVDVTGQAQRLREALAPPPAPAPPPPPAPVPEKTALQRLRDRAAHALDKASPVIAIVAVGALGHFTVVAAQWLWARWTG